MEYQNKKYFLIFDEIKGGYWDRITKKFRGIIYATEYEGNSEKEIEMIIINDPDLKNGYYSVKTIIRKIKKE